jgi:predicted nucleic acid-binding Zn ribbon protein
MFRREVQSIKDLVMRNLRVQGLETPLLQKRLIESWPEVAGEVIAKYTSSVSIYNQTLVVHITLPALRADLSMRKQEFIKKLNDYVEAQIISDIRFC